MSDQESDLSAFEFEPPLDQSSELEAEGDIPTAQRFEEMLAEVEKENPPPAPMLRRGTHEDPLPRMTAVDKMIEFINTTRRLPIEKIESKLVNESMPVMLWRLREFALKGLYTDARAVEIWLNWAAKITSRPKRPTKDASTVSGALFDARLTKGDVIDVVPEKKKKGHFGAAGDFIGKDKKPSPASGGKK